MLVVVKKPRIRASINGIGEKLLIKGIRKLYPSAKITPEDNSVDITTTDWWKKRNSTSHAGTMLWAYRDNAGLTVEQLSKLSGIARPHLSAMEKGTRAIGVLSAKKLASALGVDHRLFL